MFEGVSLDWPVDVAFEMIFDGWSDDSPDIGVDGKEEEPHSDLRRSLSGHVREKVGLSEPINSGTLASPDISTIIPPFDV